MDNQYYTAGGAILGCIIVGLAVKVMRKSPRLPLPPGPKGYPVIGNLLDAPKPEDRPWVVYDEWRKIYGDTIYFEILGQPFLILGTLERTQEIFEQRSTKYSSRPPLPMIRDLMGWDFNMAFYPYGDQWRKDRRAFHQHFHSGIVETYQPIQLQEAHVFLKLLLDAPDGFLNHVRHVFSATILRVAYGLTVEPYSNSVYASNAETAVSNLAKAAIPGSFLVDLIPALKYVPDWFPGAGFKTTAAQWKLQVQDFARMPFEHVNRLMKEGKAAPSLLLKLLDALPEENDPSRAEEEFRAMAVPATAYAAGADTTVASVQSFFLAMAMYPDVAKRAQAELDSVLGPNRLPEFSDKPSLPYINAIVKECLRWQLVTNLAVAHTALEDDEYNGYFIPKGTIVMGNAWAILHDPDVFESPEEFIPERYLKDGELNPDVRDPDIAAFGFGRRICPGRHFGNQNLFILVASTLCAFDIKAPLNEDGKPIKLTPEYTSGLLSYPVPFKCRIIPRSAAIPKIIQDSLDAD